MIDYIYYEKNMYKVQKYKKCMNFTLNKTGSVQKMCPHEY